MKKALCACLVALLLVGCAAFAEDAEIIEVPDVEVVQLEGDVSVRSVDESILDEAGEAAEEGEADAFDPETSAEPEATDAPELTPAPGSLLIRFEDGFALQLPEGWQYHATDEEMAEQGVVYCLSDAENRGWLYIQIWHTDCADMDELKALIDRTTEVQTSGVYAFNGTDFVVYDLTEGDVSCCAALLNDRVLNLVFTPQSDADFMAVAAQILNTFQVL